MVLFLGIGPPFVNPGDCPSGQHLDSHKEGASSQWSASIPLRGVPSLSGSCPLGRGTALGTVTTSPISQEKVFSFPAIWNNLYFSGYGFLFLWTAVYASCQAGAHPHATVMHIRLVSLDGHVGRKG